MNFSSYISCGLQSASMCSNKDSDSSSHNSIMDFFLDFPLCCQYTEDVETIFRPPFVGEDPDREGIAHGNNIMETPWRPPLYRDTSLLVAPRYADKETQPPSVLLPKTITPSIGMSHVMTLFHHIKEIYLLLDRSSRTMEILSLCPLTSFRPNILFLDSDQSDAKYLANKIKTPIQIQAPTKIPFRFPIPSLGLNIRPRI